jgi:beta-glucosidase
MALLSAVIPVTELLKDELGFDGFVISDYAAVAELIMHRMAEDERAAAQIAFNAGVDMEMVTDCFVNHLSRLVEDGAIPTERLDDAVRRVLTAKFSLGLFERPYADRSRYHRQFLRAQSAARR